MWGWGILLMNEINKKDVLNRLATIGGHIEGIKKMVVENRTCEEVLVQLLAIESSINKLGKKILKDHLNVCVKQGIKEGNTQVLDTFGYVLDKYL